jgi:predicted nucleic acid-binding protein
LPDEIAVSVVTAAELELGVLRATDPGARATRLRTLSRVRAEYPLLEIDNATASCFARIADSELRAGRILRRHDVWIAATAMRHDAAVVTQDADFGAFEDVEVIRA